MLKEQKAVTILSIKHHLMKTYGGTEVKLQVFLTSELYGDER
jgi:hypothetical protein